MQVFNLLLQKANKGDLHHTKLFNLSFLQKSTKGGSRGGHGVVREGGRGFIDRARAGGGGYGSGRKEASRDAGRGGFVGRYGSGARGGRYGSHADGVGGYGGGLKGGRGGR